MIKRQCDPTRGPHVGGGRRSRGKGAGSAGHLGSK